MAETLQERIRRAKKAKPLPLYRKPARSMSEYVRRVLRMIGPKSWTQGTRARNGRGVAVAWNSVGVVKVCLLGALDRSDDSNRRCELERAIETTLPKRYDASIPYYNDAAGRDYSEVIAVVKKAARKLKVKV